MFLLTGTTDELAKKIPGCFVVHSPVRGAHAHPGMEDGLKTFTKYIGVPDVHRDTIDKMKPKLEAALAFVPDFHYAKAKESELAKLVSTTLYGLSIAAITDISKTCNELNINFDDVFTTWQETYNSGVMKQGRMHAIRPVLAPTTDDKIGGHCVIPNARLLQNLMPSLANFVLRYDDTKEGSNNSE